MYYQYATLMSPNKVITAICGSSIFDTVEADSCIDDSTDKRFLSKTQLIDILTAGRFNPKVFVTCEQDKECGERWLLIAIKVSRHTL